MYKDLEVYFYLTKRFNEKGNLIIEKFTGDDAMLSFFITNMRQCFEKGGCELLHAIPKYDFTSAS